MRFATCLVALALCAAATVGHADDLPTRDVAGSHDHPVVSRYAGSVIGGYQQLDYDEVVLPLGKADWDAPDHFAKARHVEGKVTRIFYVAPEGKSGLAVFRNFRDALTGAGFHVAFECSGDDGANGCGGTNFAESVNTSLYDVMQARNLMIDTLVPSDGNVRALTAHLDRPEGNVDLSLLVGQSANYPVGVLLQIVEAKPMATGQVSVDAKAMAQGLAGAGHIALYGIHFTSDSATLTADSDTTLKQMATLLESQPALRVYIVGHTDNSGAAAHNVALSQKRAEAVAKALSTRYGIAPARMTAKGIASFAPVASNHSDAGKAKNRRVELVEQ